MTQRTNLSLHQIVAVGFTVLLVVGCAERVRQIRAELRMGGSEAA